MTLITGTFCLPYGPGGSSAATGTVTFTQNALSYRQGAIYLPTSVVSPITDGQMEPVELSPGLWKVCITSEHRTFTLPAVAVEGEQVHLTADAAAGDGTYFLTLEKDQAIAHVGDGSYEIGPKNG